MISVHCEIRIPDEIEYCAELIKFNNYSVTHPKNFHKTRGTTFGDASYELLNQLAPIIGCDKDEINWVLFSACSGAEEHVDMLPDDYDDITYLIPVILPNGENKIYAGDSDEAVVKLSTVYSFDHTVKHSMTVQDDTGGCVLIMATKINKNK